MGEISFYKELESILSRKEYDIEKEKLHKLKIKLAGKHKLKKTPTDIQILLNTNLRLKTKPGRTGSGVAVIAIMTKSMKCPHGKCSYCPGGPDSAFGDVPQSYTGKEPATMRAMRNKYDSYLQVFNRLEQYIVMGHVPEKVELIIMGGTFPSFPKKYQESFIKYAFKAMNDFGKLFYSKKGFNISKFKRFFELPGEVGDPSRVKKVHKKILEFKAKCELEKEQIKNEHSKIKCVGLTIETRPDYATLKHGNEMLRLGATRVEIGVQSVYENVLKKIERGHTVRETIESIRVLKDLGFKINAHYMPGLPGINRKKDLEGMKQLFSDKNFRPDMLKLYPCMVMKGTKLYKEWQKNKFKPITTKQAAELIAEFKKSVPKYVRIMRVQRDIPTYMTKAGVDRTNLRQYIAQYMKNKGIECKCIRCREPKNKLSGKQELKIQEYDASNGKEFFISIEDKNNLYGFCRLRFPSENRREEITKNSALIRELHVYGEATAVGSKGEVQHKGFGKKLLKMAEKIAKQNRKDKIIIISGIGVRSYYRKLGYKKQGVYMVKRLQKI